MILRWEAQGRLRPPPRKLSRNLCDNKNIPPLSEEYEAGYLGYLNQRNSDILRLQSGQVFSSISQKENYPQFGE